MQESGNEFLRQDSEPGRESTIKPAIRLEFIRHDKREKAVEKYTGPRVGDNEARLSKEGRASARRAGRSRRPHPEVAMAYGSLRDRAIETSLHHMLALDERISEDTTLEETRAVLARDQKVGKKEVMTAQLDFNWNGTPEFNKIAYGHYSDSKDALKFMVEESDDLVRRLGDGVSTSYSRAAGNQAEIVRHYLEILPNWQRVAKAKPEKYAGSGYEMQRFLAGHGSTIESLLLKIIEKTEGRQGVVNFIESLPDKNQFGLSEGYTLELSGGQDGQPRVIAGFKDRQWEVGPQVIDAIIRERDELDRAVKEREK